MLVEPTLFFLVTYGDNRVVVPSFDLKKPKGVAILGSLCGQLLMVPVFH
jgi:hypothetical protein